MPNSRHSHDYRVPLHQIVDMLSARTSDLVRELLPRAVLDGHEWKVGDLSGTPGRSLSISNAPGRRGVWADFSTNDKGDALELVAAVLFGGNKVDAIKWAKGWLGLDGTDPASLRQTRRAVEVAKDDPDAAEDEAKRRRWAQGMFLGAKPILGTPADEYLFGRGIDIRRLSFPLGALRFAAAIRNPETRAHHPAMVAAIVGADGNQLAVHRTYLQPAPGGGFVKLQGVKDAKLSLGRFSGGFIPLWKGETTDPHTGEIRKGLPLSRVKTPVWVDITEGIEDGLSVAVADPSLRVIVAVSVSNWANIQLPEQVAGVCLWQQNDPPDSSAARSFARVIENFQKQGKQIALARPPEGVKDANDVLRGVNHG